MGLEGMKPGKRTLPWSGLEVAMGNEVLEVYTQENGAAELYSINTLAPKLNVIFRNSSYIFCY